MYVSGVPARLRCGLSFCPSRVSFSFHFRLMRAVLCLLILAFSVASGLLPRAAWAQTSQQATVNLAATVSASPAQITLEWRIDFNATSYTILRKAPGATSFTQIGTIPAASAPTAFSYTDSSVSVGTAYEYEVVKQAETPFTAPATSGIFYSGNGYVASGINVPLTDNRGAVVLVVDNTYSSDPPMFSRISRLQQDLTGDGWLVLTHFVNRDPGLDGNTGVPLDRGAGVRAVKQLIRTDYTNQAANDPQHPVRAVFVLGHVPVPYSGNVAPDGHSDVHSGAWPCDSYYGDIGPESHWTDSSVNITTSDDPRNYNVPGDGKFDQSNLPGPVALEVGRVDLDRLPSFAQGEEQLLEQYLDKDHNFRQGYVTTLPEGRIDDNFGYFNGENFAGSGWRNFAALLGPLNASQSGGAYFSDTNLGSFLWSDNVGPGSYNSASGVGSTASYAQNDPHSVFFMQFGSFFGDWDSSDNFLRAPLATPTFGLTDSWAGRPAWFYQHMALGNEIGYSTVVSVNNAQGGSAALGLSNYDPVDFNGPWAALMGDPTLRLQVTTPPSGLTAVTSGSSVTLTWHPSPDNVPTGNYGGNVTGYNVYRAATAAGPFTKIGNVSVGNNSLSQESTLSLADNSPLSGPAVYQVRAVNLETSGSGSYQNQSQGIFQSYNPATPAPSVALIAPFNFENPNGGFFNPTNGALYTAPSPNITIQAVASANATGATISRVDFYLNGIFRNGSNPTASSDSPIGTATTDPYTTQVSNLPPGEYFLRAVATDSNGATTTSQSVRVYVFDPGNGLTIYSSGFQNGWTDTTNTNNVTESDANGAHSITFKNGGTAFVLTHTPFDTSPYSNLFLEFDVTTGPPNGTNPVYPTVLFSIPLQTGPPSFHVSNLGPSQSFHVQIPVSGYLGTNNGYQQANIDGLQITDLNTPTAPGGTVPNYQAFTIANVQLTENGRRGDRLPSVILRNLTDTSTTPPTVLAPLDGSSVYGAPHSFQLFADAADPDASLAVANPTTNADEVDLYDNGVFVQRGTFVGPSNSGPNFSSYQFTMTNVPLGVHKYTVTAIDTLGAVGTSNPATVTVLNNLAGLVSGTTPAGTSALTGATVTVTDGGGNTVATYTTAASSSGSDNKPANYGGSLPPGTYKVTASAPGYVTSPPSNVVLQGGVFKRQDITLLSIPTLGGLVSGTTPAGTSALTGATVTVKDSTNATVATLTTGANTAAPDGSGNVNYLSTTVAPPPPLAAGTYTVTVAAAGFAPSTPQPVILSNGSFSRADFTLLSIPTLGGLVSGTTPANTSALTGATVTVKDSTNATVATLTTGANTAAPDGSGNVNYLSTTVAPPPPLAAGTYTVTVAAAGFVPSTPQPVTLTNGKFTRADVTLLLLPTVQGLVSNAASGVALTGATVTVKDSTNATVATLTTPTSGLPSSGNGADGKPVNYQTFLPLGTYTVTGTLAGYGPVTKTVVLSAGGTTTRVDLPLPPPPTLEGLITDPKSTLGLGGATVTVTDHTTHAVIATITSSAVNSPGLNNVGGKIDGPINYFDTPLPPGTYDISATAPNHGTATATSQVFTIGTVTRVDLVVPLLATQLGGLVTDAATGTHQQNIPVIVTDPFVNPIQDTGGNAVSLTTGADTTGPDNNPVNYLNVGDSLVPGTYTVSVSTPTYLALPQQVTLTANTFKRLDLSLLPRLQSVTVASGSTFGGSSPTTGTITLTAPAPAGGMLVSLSSSNTGAATVPANVTVPANQTTVTFPITTSSLGTAASATITATLNGDTQTATLTVNPPQLTALSLAPNSVVGGNASTGTVTIGSAAPAGGVVVNLSAIPAAGSSASSVSLPATVTIPANATSATFKASTSGVASAQSLTITATLGGSSQSATLAILPASVASLTLAPASVIGSLPSTGTVTLSGQAPAGGLTIYLSSSSPSVTVPATITVQAGQTSASFTATTNAVNAATTATISASTTATFTPSTTQTATLTLGAAGFNFTITVGSSGTATATSGTPATGTVTLGVAAPANTTVTLSSNNAAATVPGSVTVLAGQTSASFVINTHNVTSSTSVTITATLAGLPKTATLTVTPNAGLSYPSGLNMISLPYNYSGVSLATIFGFSPVVLYSYDPAKFGYDTITDPGSVPPPGMGFFINFPKATTVTQVGTPVDTTQNQLLPLSQGWNLIGDPFLVDEPLSGLQVIFNTTTTGYSKATNLVSSPYGYTPNGSYYTLSSGQSLKVGQGYWVYASQPVTLVIPHP